MPPPLDLIGRRFGKLLVLHAGEPMISASGKSREKTWVCHCDCGREESIPDRRIPHCPSNARRGDVAESCRHCRSQRACVVCGKPFESVQYRACCDDVCHTLRKQALYREDYYRRAARDPDHNKNRAASVKSRAMTDVELAARLKQYEETRRSKHQARLRADPEYRERVNAQGRVRYHLLAAKIQKARRLAREVRLATMTDAEFDAWVERRRKYWRKAANKIRVENYEWYMETMRRHRQKQALARLSAVGPELAKMVKK